MTDKQKPLTEQLTATFLQETARLKPAVGPGQTFIVKKDMQLTQDLLVPKGVIFSIPHYAMFTNPLLWPNNNDFLPGAQPHC